MRKSTRIRNPVFTITVFYAGLVGLVFLVAWLFPQYAHWLPFGGIDELLASSDEEIIATLVNAPVVEAGKGLTLALAIVGALLVTTPITWVYFITTRTKQVDRSFAQTIMVLPVVVSGIAVIVQNSLALAFSLAGVVAAVRFRFALEEPAHALYIFAAIAIGLGAGIGAVEIAFIVSVGFVYSNLALWKLDYGADLTSPFFSFLTGRGRDDQDL
ncbi:MAG: DUF4956 domain-containing protein [Pseudomonadota bacterium]